MVKNLKDICGEGYSNTIYLAEDLNLLIVGYDLRIMYLNIENLENIQVFS